MGRKMERDVEKILISEEEIKKRVKEIGAQISKDYEGKDLLVVGVLRGAVIFMADLARSIPIPVEFDFMAVSSYGVTTRTSGVVRILKDLDQDIRGKHVLLVEDIVDTGLTVNYLLKNLRSRAPASFEVCALLSKQEKQRVSLNIKYLGFSIRDEFVVGYGLDYAQKYRNLPYVCTLKPQIYEVISED
jgi:hypoxanthine phosphoribosyltransferase